MILKDKESSLARPINYLLMKAKGQDLCSSNYQSSPEKTAPLKNSEMATVDNRTEMTAEEQEAIAKEEARGTWGSQWDFAMSCIAYAVGLGNVWRFPYLCYKNGGGAFLIPYMIAMLTCGIPLFLLEVSVGQYLGVGGMSVVGQLCPILKGVGYSALMMVFLENVYYIIVVAWTLFYILNTLYNLSVGLPWDGCDKGNGTWAKEDCFDPESGVPYNESSAFLIHGLLEKDTMPPVESYWNNNVLQISSGIEELGGIRWELMAYLALAWCLVYLVIWKGLHNSGKIIWASAMFPYIILTILFVKAMTLDGAVEGIKYLFTPDWDRLKTSECWIDGGTQIFFSYGVGIGALLALGSYNKFHHNCYRDALFVCCINTATSLYSGIVIFAILGFMAKQKGVEDIGEVVKSGPGLAFLVYPEVVRQLEPSALWAILFFLMLFTLGIDSQFCGIESLIVGLVDNWPKYLRPRKILFTAAMCVFMFTLGLPMITNGGIYIFQLMDFYAASGMSLLWCVFFQTIAICWFFGAKKVYNCIELMVGFRINYYWYFSWVVFAPCFMVSIFIFYFVKYTPITYGGTYTYPGWGEVLGFGISWSSMIFVPGYAIYFLATTEGTFKERLIKGITPSIKPRPDAIIALEKQRQRKSADAETPDVEMKLVEPESNHL